MKKRLSSKNAFFLLTALASGIVIFTFFHLLSAEISPLSAIDDSITAGKQQLFSRTVSGALQAHQTFLSATNQYDATADNQQKIKLHFYLALTRLADIILRNDGQGADTLRKLLAQYGITFTGDNFDAIASHLPANAQDKPILPASAPSGDALRAFLAGPFLTAINASIADMDTVIGLLDGTGSSESKEILLKSLLDPQNQDPAMQDVEVDDGDYYLLRTGLKFLKGYILTMTAYNQDFDARELVALMNADMFNFQNFLDRHPNLLTVRAGGPAALAVAKQTFISAIDDYMIASDKIRNDTSLQPGATELVTIDNYAWQKESQVRTRLMQIRTSLADPAQPVIQFADHNENWTFQAMQGGMLKTLTAKFYSDFTGGNYSSPDTTFSNYGNLDYAVVKGAQITLRFVFYNGWAEFNGTMNGGSMTGTYNAQNSTLGNFSGTFTASRTGSTDSLSDRINLNPIFGDGTTALNPRDLLPQFSTVGTVSSGPSLPGIAGTMGHGLGDDPTLGGIAPDQTQAIWQQNSDALFQTETFTIPERTITVDGLVNDWDNQTRALVDTTGEAAMPSKDITALYLAKNTIANYLYFRIDLAGSYNIPNIYSEFHLTFPRVQGSRYSMVGDIGLTISYNAGTNTWNLLKQTFKGNNTFTYSTNLGPGNVSVSPDGRSIEGRIALTNADPTKAIGEIGGRFISVDNADASGSYDLNFTGIQITPAATVTGTLNVPGYNGQGPIYIEAYRYASSFDTDTSDKLGSQVIFPGEYSAGMQYAVNNLPVGEKIFLFVHWDKDMNGVVTPGDYTNFYVPLTTLAGNNSQNLTTSDNHPSFPLLEFKEAKVYNSRSANGTTTMQFQARISGPSPDDVAITVHGPGGDFTLSPSMYQQQKGLSYNIPSAARPGNVPDGDYTFEAVDSLGRRVTSAPYNYVYSNSLPLVSTTAGTFSPANRAFVNTTTPTFSWQAPASGGPYYYQVRVQDWLGNDVWFQSNIQTETSVTVPDGLLQPDTPYSWSIRLFDSADHPMNRTQTNSLAFHTGTGGAPAIASVSLETRPPAGTGTKYSTGIGGRLTNTFPDEVKVIRLKDPSGVLLVGAIPALNGYSFTNNPNYSISYSSATPPVTGAYTIEIDVQRTGGALQTLKQTGVPYSYHPVAPMDLTSLTPADNYYFDTTTPTFSWNAVNDPNTYYQFSIRDPLNNYTIWNSSWSKDPSLTVPPGILESIGTYYWRVRYASDYDPLRDSTMGKYSSDAFTTDGSMPPLRFTINKSPAIFPPPAFKDVSMYSRRYPSGYDGTFMSALISGPSPDDVTITVEGPGGVFTLPPDRYYQQKGLRYTILTSLSLPAGDYTFKAVDSLGRKATPVTYHYEYNGTLPFIDTNTLSPPDRTFVGTTTPVFSWSAPAGGGPYYYKVWIMDWLNEDVWFVSGMQTATSLTVPAGLLQPNTPYKWFVRVFDSDLHPMNATQQSASLAFHTGAAQIPALQQINLGTRPTGNGYSTSIHVFLLAGVFPDEVKTFRLIGPAGNAVATGSPTITYRFENSAYYSLSYSSTTPPVTGNYVIEADYQRAGEAQPTTLAAAAFPFTYHPVLPVDIASLTPTNNAYFDTVTPSFSWSPVSDPNTYYRLHIRDPLDATEIWNSDWSKATTISVPVGILMRGGTYYWRLQSSSDYDPLQSAMTGKFDSYTFMMANGSITNFRFTVNSSSPVLKGDVNDDGRVDMMDAVLALQVLAGMNKTAISKDYKYSGADVGNNGQIGAEDLLYILQWVSGLRLP